MTTAERDYYEVLGVPRDADAKTIKDAYHRLAMRWHPDRNRSPEAEERFKEIAKAYAVLHDPDKRSRYDARGHEGIAHFTADDLFGGVDLGSIFSDLGVGFGPGGESIFERFFRAGATPRRGANLRLRLDLSLDRVDEGGAETVHLVRPVVCGRCHGHGTRSGKPPTPCPACGGSGQTVASRESHEDGSRTVRIQQLSTCATCHGRGTAAQDACEECGGRGRLERAETLQVTVPPGIEDGMTLRVEGHGTPGPEGGAPGDLHVTVFTAPDPRFQRRGADLWRNETIDVVDAVLGTTRRVPTLDGHAQVMVPPGTQPDTVLRLEGKGVRRFSAPGRGNLNVRVQVVVPRRLDDEARALYRRLRALGRRHGGA